jgi:hypothetical protein
MTKIYTFYRDKLLLKNIKHKGNAYIKECI